MDEPVWRVALRGNLLITSRGVTLSRAEGFRPGLLPECHRLADLTEAGAAELLGCSDSEALGTAPTEPTPAAARSGARSVSISASAAASATKWVARRDCTSDL